MKKMLLTIGLLTPVLLLAQVKHFLYFQTEGRQPFYARLDRNLYSSSASGYLIIPKLVDGSYRVSIGFPKGQFPEQIFNCKVENNDAGYLVKNFGDKGWGLFNLQSLDVAMAGTEGKDLVVGSSIKADDFSSMLSDAVKDPSIRRVQPESDKKGSAAAKLPDVSPTPDNATISKTIEDNGAIAPASQQTAVAISRKLINYVPDGVELVFIETTLTGKDTIHIFIPAEKDTVNTQHEVAIAASSNEVPKALDVVAVQKDSVVNAQLPVAGEKESKSVANNIGEKVANRNEQFLPMEIERSEVVVVAQDSSLPKVPVKAPMINSDCKAEANDEDFLKLRKKMAAAADDDKMIGIATKVFKTRCFSTNQIRNLAVLFLTDAGKYKFFDVAYQYVSDSHNFGELQALLVDTYYISRFKAMVNR